MAETQQDLLKSLSKLLAEAIKDSATVANENAAQSRQRSPPFLMSPYCTADGAQIGEYFTQFTRALDLSKVPEEQHAKFALVYMGNELNSALRILVSPSDPENLSYSEIRSKLSAHFDSTRNIFAESIKFRQTIQSKGEAVAAFALRLRQAAVHCEYGTFLDRMLIEQLIYGLESRETCDEIILKKPATFTAAYEIAHALEATRNASDEVKTHTKTESTHKIDHFKTTSLWKNRNQRVQSRSRLRHQGQPKGHQKDPNGSIRHHNDQAQGNHKACAGCGEAHARIKCRFRHAKCNTCGRTGHISKVCRSGGQSRSTNQLTDGELPSKESDTVQVLSRIETVGSVPSAGRLMINVQIEGAIVKMELDTGAPCSIISKQKLSAVKPNFQLQRTNRKFASYTGHRINCIGRTPVNTTIGATTKLLNLYVIDGEFDTLLGREWIAEFVNELNLQEILGNPCNVHQVTEQKSLNPDQQSQMNCLLSRYADLFNDTPGKLTGPPAKMHLKPGASPVFSRAREIPLALRDAYAKEIDAKIASGFYKRVDYSEWASTTHVVVKKNGKLRITGNYKPTLNPRIIIDEHPIPKVEFLFNQMKGATLFCHLDITDAYTHMEVDEEFSHALTLNTPTHGLIRPARAVYGAANIPALWQRRMDTVLQDLPNVVNFFDDIIVYADRFDNLLQILGSTLERFRSHGLKLNRSKCTFAEPVLEALGHKVDASGVHKSDAHIRAVQNAPKPSTPEELQLFLGKATYYSSFIADLSTRNRPLRDMLLKDPFVWTLAGEKAYLDIKQALISPQVLMLYDPGLPLLLATDASKTGLGAVLSHRLGNGQERPIAYASRTMTTTEQRYPQIDKEALAIVWAVQKFFNYLYARHFTLITDHKPLTQILHPEKSLPVLCISRMANYADYLAHFNFDVIFKTSKANANADYCSRVFPQSTINAIHQTSSHEKEEAKDYDDFDHFVLHQVSQLPVCSETIAREIRKDQHLGKIVKLLESGQDLSRNNYKAPEAKYTLAANCLLFEHRVVVPPTLREAILNDLHAAHIGIVKMKGIARSFVFWPGIDSDIERVAKTCSNCATHAHAPPKFRQHHWEYPKAPWERVHIDYAGPIADTMLLVIVDAHSKWIEVKATTSATSTATITLLDELFAAYGAPVTIVSDNGTQFTSEQFKEFLRDSGVKYHKTTAPYHPSTNGQAERYVGTVKDALYAMKTTKGSLQRNLNEFLRQYRKAPHSTTGQSPAKLFLGRDLRTRLDMVRPDSVYTNITQRQQAQMDSTYRTLIKGQSVYFLSGNPKMDKWTPGTIATRLGDLHYEIEYKGKRFKRHIDQIRCFADQPISDEPEEVDRNQCQPSDITTPPRRVRFHEPATSAPTVDGLPLPLTVSTPVTPVERRSTSTTPVVTARGNHRESAAHPPQGLQLPRRSRRLHFPPSRYSPS